jgi:dihydrofolate reductase
MRQLILKMSISLDGFVCGPQGELDWVFRSSDEGVSVWELELLSSVGLHIMGSQTFHDMAAYWPTSNERIASPMNKIPKAVFSRTGELPAPGTAPTTRGLDDARKDREARGDAPLPAAAADLESWQAPHIARGPLNEEIARLKREDGRPILAHGGAGFAQSLVAEGLIDEYRLLVHPVVLGRGRALFETVQAPRDLELISSTRFPSGANAVVYKPAG